MNAEEIVTDMELYSLCVSRDRINEALLACACGRWPGGLLVNQLGELSLVGGDTLLTPKGRAYLWAAFGNQ